MTAKSGTIEAVPDYLIYEMDEGKPIYYKGYKEYLSDNENYEVHMPDSNLQSWLKVHLCAFLISLFLNDKSIVITGGEQGLSLKKKSWRGADIAIFKKSNFVLNSEYSKLPPEVVIEINVKGHFDSDEKMLLDFERKNAQLLEFGVKKIIWIFTETQFIMSITNEGRIHHKWDENIPVITDATFNIQKMLDEFND